MRMIAALALLGAGLGEAVAGQAAPVGLAPLAGAEPPALSAGNGSAGDAASLGARWTLRGRPGPAAQGATARPALPSRPGRSAVMVFGGPAVSARLGRIFAADLHDGVMPVGFAGAAVSREVARWHGFSIELEAGLGAQVGRRPNASTPQFWAAAFLRYDRFPWNHRLRTTIAGSVGANYALRETSIEIHGKERRTRRWLHYLAPEISFARPRRPGEELVLRLHHPSSAFGLFGCKACASNVLTAGLRKRF